MAKRHLLLILCIILSIPSLGVETMIQGNAFYYRNKKIQIHQYQDLFTFKSVSLIEQQIGDDGNFKLILDIEKTGLYLVKIGKVNSHLFIVPGDQYTLVIPEPLEMDRFNPAKDVFVQPEIFESETRLNANVTNLEQKLNRFFIEKTSGDFKLRSAGNIRNLADTFRIEVENEFSKIEDPYFQSYLHFRLAEFDLTTRHSRENVYTRYFKDHDPAYDQLSFANAFDLFYGDFLTPHSLKPFSDSLESAIKNRDVERAKMFLSTDKHLQNPKFLELLLTTGLYNLGREKIYELEIVIEMLDTIKFKTDQKEILDIANSAESILLKLAPGTRVPDFVFADVVGNLYRISEYEGYYIYIQFFDDFNSESLRQMSLMKVLREGYGADIAMFSFSTSESLKRLREIPGKHDFDWFFGKVVSPEEVVSNYDLRAMPAYFFLDEELKIVNSPTPPPGARIEKLFAKIWNEKHPNKMMPFKLQPPDVSERDLRQTHEK